MDLRDLLPENVFEAFVSVGDNDKEKKKKKKVPIESFQDWALAYTAWASTIVAATPSKGLELLQYLGIIGRLAWDNPPPVWLHYDKQFRQMAAAVPHSTKWDELHFQFLQWAKQAEPSSLTKEACRRWNEAVIVSSPPARKTTTALFVVEITELSIARPRELLLTLLPVGPGVSVPLDPLQCLWLPHAEEQMWAFDS